MVSKTARAVDYDHFSGHICHMKMLAKSEFKARMLEIMRTIESSGEEVVVTDHGRPCIVVKPYRQAHEVQDVFADIKGQLVLHEDPDEPTLMEWPNA